ncbi:L,D-transpeptidase family protein [Helicobacter sp.]|uniref:L,D-transpeptidase family protein n=1 Tax=Helicobacter sp. TaxID=218 RepID=UPI0025B8871F|nr:L,D-transpeptidase family protein [Helicobacter sp.]MCI5969459.1 L,D-transpeptidase family protein [Helicobacter sp.]MDY2584220.1 L,D-transpeptidase family protein [Helicobacter sp.]
MNIFKVVSLCLVLSFANASDLEWVELYKKGGVSAIEQKIDSMMQTRDFWDAALKTQDTRFGYYEELEYLFIATKDAPTLRLYALNDGKWDERLNVESIVGSKGGHKEKEGDLATPIGVYALNARLVNLDQFYGPLAFTTNYPNLYDRLQKRTGYGIWIHGMPLDGNREDLNTRGCIAIENDKLRNVDAIVDYRKSLLITYEKGVKEVKKEDLGILLADLYVWRDAWKESNADKYLEFYSKDFIRFDGMRYDEFEKNKRRIFSKKETKEILFSKINISPYPNDANKDLFRISFYEDYKAPSYKFSGAKELYVELKDSKMQILAER